MSGITTLRQNSTMLMKVLCGAALVISFGSANAQNLKETATCKLTNTAEDKTLYEGSCKVTQSMSGKNTIFSVKMGNTEPFKFAGVRGQTDWMHGPEEVQFTDLPNGGIFRWSDFALVIAEQEGRASSNSGYSSNSGGGFSLTGRASGHCKLSNVSAGRELYNGRCSIKESINGSSTVFDIKMGSAESFLFATSDGRNWMHGPEEVRFEDRGHTGIFRWAEFRLEVDQD